MDPAATPTRITVAGSFSLPSEAPTALMLFTPEGERAWVEGWAPTYLSGAIDEVGAVWTTEGHSHTVWVTVVRTDDHITYARASDNGTAGIVDVRCLPAADGGASVRVTYDLRPPAPPGRRGCSTLLQASMGCCRSGGPSSCRWSHESACQGWARRNWSQWIWPHRRVR